MSEIQNSIILKSLAIGGYKSFREVQRFERFAKINLFIGQNNCGKSNVLRFIHYIYPQIFKKAFSLEEMDRPLPLRAPFTYGVNLYIPADGNETTEYDSHVLPKFNSEQKSHAFKPHVLQIFRKKIELDDTNNHIWFYYDEKKSLIPTNWNEAFTVLKDPIIYGLWNALTAQQNGDIKSHWIPETKLAIKLEPTQIASVIIPAIRQISANGDDAQDYSGQGIIARLARLQNPHALSQIEKDKFEKINQFLVNVTDNPTARIEIPFDRDTILVHMDGKTLHLESLGTGIHEVIILAAAATTLENTVICMEEPELHLNPILQKKLIRYLSTSTNNQYFISTHSAALMDTPNAEIYHISLTNNQSIVERVTSDKHRSEVCKDLGYHPSDLLQTNCIIWVEGPSDRIYLNFWLKTINKGLIEGIHYSIMFYGGRLASHLSCDSDDEFIDDFISLRRLNRRTVIIIDSDRQSAHAGINSTKSRLKEEFNTGPGYAWVTKGREIENYLKADFLKLAIKDAYPSASINSHFGQYENVLSAKTKKGKEIQVSKVSVANHITQKSVADFSVLDLDSQMKQLIEFILESNPSTHR